MLTTTVALPRGGPSMDSPTTSHMHTVVTPSETMTHRMSAIRTGKSCKLGPRAFLEHGGVLHQIYFMLVHHADSRESLFPRSQVYQLERLVTTSSYI